MHEKAVEMIIGLRRGRSWREVPHSGPGGPDDLLLELISHLATCDEPGC